MKTLDPAPKFLIYAVAQAIRHPKSPIKYLYCSECKVRIPANGEECPVCHKRRGNSPEERQESPIPWWGSCLVIAVGIGAWVVSACLDISGLGEAARVLVYVPLGNLFGMSLQR